MSGMAFSGETASLRQTLGVDGQATIRWDWAGVACCLTGVVLMIIGPTQGAAAQA